MANDIITRTLAKEKGLVRYFTGAACPSGHIAERRVVNATCSECHKTGTRKWRADNPDAAKTFDKRHYELNRQYQQEYYKRNKARNRANYDRWRAENPEKSRGRVRRRRAKEANASGSHTVDQILELLELQLHKCANCKCKLTTNNRHLDHIQPLSKGGSNDISNLQWLCFSCNTSKGARDPFAWAMENGRLL